MSRPRYFGLDLAWSAKNPTGACALDADGRIVDERMLGSDDEIIEWIADLIDGPAVVAIDAPLLVPNETGRRPCENDLQSEYGSRKAGPHSSNRSRLVGLHGEVRGEVLAGRLTDLGFDDPWAGGERTLIEVYPHPAIVEVFGLDERLIYKSKRGVSVNDRRVGLRTLSALIGLLQEALPPLHGPAVNVADDVRGAAMKAVEDRLDARLCAWIASVWGTMPERMRLFGDAAKGHIAVPVGQFAEGFTDASLSNDPRVVDETYLPYTVGELLAHMPPGSDSGARQARWAQYYTVSAARYLEFRRNNPDRRGLPITEVRGSSQIEKDERFWVAASMMALVRAPNRTTALTELLEVAFPAGPPDGLGSWAECVGGDLALFLEPQLPAPRSYREWLRNRVDDRAPIPYVQAAARKRASDEIKRNLEGSTHADALIVNPSNGFALLVEAKVLSDVSYHVTFDERRNQIARNLDVMLDAHPTLPYPLSTRVPQRTLFCLLTPQVFKEHPHTRLYGWLMEDYRRGPSAIERDLPHRANVAEILKGRIGWITFEKVAKVVPNACPWLDQPGE